VVHEVTLLNEFLSKPGETTMSAEPVTSLEIDPGAQHRFCADYRASNRKQAAEDARRQMQARSRQYKVLG
jgi:carboxymethylenebutenolidase